MTRSTYPVEGRFFPVTSFLTYNPSPPNFLKVWETHWAIPSAVNILGHYTDQRMSSVKYLVTIIHYWFSYRDFTHPHAVLSQ